MKNKILTLVEATGIKADPTDFRIGDTVDVHQRILEGQKERVQIFSGVVISRRGSGMSEMFTVRRIVQSEGVERIFPVNSPKISKIEVKRSGAVRRAKLYYLRDRVGKATRLRERKLKPHEVAAQAAAAAAAAEVAAAAAAAVAAANAANGTPSKSSTKKKKEKAEKAAKAAK